MINKHDEPNRLHVKASLAFDIDISEQIITEQSLVSFAEVKLIFETFLTLSLTFRQFFFTNMNIWPLGGQRTEEN